MIKRILRLLLNEWRDLRTKAASKKGSASYWSVHMVTHNNWQNAEESLAYFDWRNDQYPGYIKLMPVKGQENKVVLDYGCGPGNDLAGFAHFSKTKKLIGVDVSKTALSAAKARLGLHGQSVDLIHVDEKENKIPLDSNSVDYIHSSGVLHHCANLSAVLKELHRILAPGGEMAVMVYNKESVWYHLYVAWYNQLYLGRYSKLPIDEAFKKLTDGPHCPISYCYSPKEFIEIMSENGFDGSFKGASISLTEMKQLPNRFDAIKDYRLDPEHRNFLKNLEFNNYGFPIHNSSVAGINACFSFVKN